MDFSGKGYVVKVGDFKDIDMWVRMACPDKGVFTGFAFGGRNSRRRFPGCLAPGNHVDYSAGMSRRGEYVDLREMSLLDGFPALPPKGGMAVSRALETLYSMTRLSEGVPSPETRWAYGALDGFMSAVRGRDDRYPFGKAVLGFRIAAMTASGLISFDGCAKCGADLSGPAPFVAAEGGVLCRGCFQGQADGRLPDGCLEAARRLALFDDVESVDTAAAMAIKDMIDMQVAWHGAMESQTRKEGNDVR